MGWKASIIIVGSANDKITDSNILKAIGFSDYKYSDDTELESCIYPKDKSISIGRYNGCVIICDDFMLSELFITKKLHTAESALSALFPNSEVLTVACHSVVNLHGYSLVKNGKKLRVKVVTADDGVAVNMGGILPEEKAIYDKSVMQDGKHVWPDGDGDFYQEDQLMEDFTFGVAKRLLGVRIDEADGEALEDVVFRKYEKKKKFLGLF